METNFLVIVTLLFFKRFGLSSNTVNMTSSNVTCIENERQSLLVFKRTLMDRHNLLSTWTGEECCEWQGVGCDSRNGHVVKLDLHSQESSGLNLEGDLSPSLQNLKHLRYLDLSMNSFPGNIPEFLGSFKRLEYLNLSWSSFRGPVPHHLGNLSRLQYLDLREDSGVYTYIYHNGRKIRRQLNLCVSVDIRWVSSLSSLRYLDLSGMCIGEHTDWFHQVNMLSSLLTLNLASTGIVIPFINSVNFTSLNSLDLSLNDITSTIPLWLSNLTSLMHLDLFGNLLYGNIPDYIGKFGALTYIDLSYNEFETSMSDVLCNLSSLNHLDLSGNRFFGHIPSTVGLLSRLEKLCLNDNHLSGNIPMSLGQLSKLDDLDLSNNSFIGALSETHFTKLTNLNNLAIGLSSLEFDLSSNWKAPFQLQIMYASSCNMIGPQFPDWLQTQTTLQGLDLSNSSIRDTIPEWFENTLSHITYLDLSDNQISGKLPRFDFDISYHTRDRTLMMNSNKFEGSLARFPSNVNFLDLADNLLSGHIPQTNATMNPNLQVSSLSNNRFTGSIVNLCKVPSIQVLDLSHNKFSGSIPGCLGNFTYLGVIDLTNNTMTGVIPSSLGYLRDLYSLHLRNNKFEGDIPASLQDIFKLALMDLGNNLLNGTIPFWIGEKLSRLVFLDLQSNKFAGKIPLQLCQLKDLRYLSLSHNNITGMIPGCLGDLSGMMTSSSDNYYSGTAYYEENVLAIMKGRELLYTRTIEFLISLDISGNNIVGEIPDALMNLVELKSLNLSRNLLKGHIPVTIGNLEQLESLDVSFNKLSGRIPQSLTSLHYLSYLNMSYNNLHY